MLINLSRLSTPDVYFTMTQTILPRPIAWVLSENANGGLNLAPYSYFNAVSSDPPMVMFSVGLQDDGSFKDTLTNLTQRTEMVIHIASCHQLADLNRSSATLPPGVSEVQTGGLDTTPVDGFRLPRLSDCKVAFMSRVHDIQRIGNNRQHIVFAEIDSVHISDDCVERDQKGRLVVLADRIEPLARLGASQYATFGDIMIAKRPD